MRYAARVARVVVCLLATALVVNVSSAQKSEREINAEDSTALGKLKDPGGREKHQGADNPMQGNTSSRRAGAALDPYGPENFVQFAEKNERRFNDPQWQLKIDLYDPKRIVIEYPDGTSKEYWYVLFRVINDNTRTLQSTSEPNMNQDGTQDPKPVGTTKSEDGLEGVPVDTTLDMEVITYTRNIDKSPWDESASQYTPMQLRNIKKVYKPVSDPFVLKQIAFKEELFEWVDNAAGGHERVLLVRPMSDFQRQLGLAHELTAPDFSGPRCLPVRTVREGVDGRVEIIRYVGVHTSDNTFAGFFGKDENAGEGVRVITDPNDPLWGCLTKRRYQQGDCVDRFGRVLQTNDPGYLNARVAGGDSGDAEYGILKGDNPLVGNPVRVPHFRRYRTAEGDKPADRVLFGFDTRVPIPGHVEDNYTINGKILNPASTYRTATENVQLWGIDGSVDVTDDLTQFGGPVAGRPVKMLDHLGRPIKRYLVTYQAGDRITKAEWEIWRQRLGTGLLRRFGNPANLHERPLTHDDPIVGLPKIKMGKGIGDSLDLEAEVITRGVDDGDRDRATGRPLLKKVENYTTGRSYDPKKVTPNHFLRDPDGVFTTHRKAPLPDDHGLKPGEDYVYAPLGPAEDDAIPVPHFDRPDQYGAWEDYRDPISGARVPLKDEGGNLVRDEYDQILYLKEYEYEYIYMYEYEPLDEMDEGFKGRYGTDRSSLIKDSVDRMKFMGDTPIGRVRQVIVETRKVTTPKAVKYAGRMLEDGTTEWILESALEGRPENERADFVLRDLRVENVQEDQEVELGVYIEGDRRYDPSKHKLRDEELPPGVTVRATSDSNESEKVIRYLEKVRDEIVAGGDMRAAKPVREDDFDPDSAAPADNGMKPAKAVYRRWTVPPPLVYANPRPKEGESRWNVLTRLSEAYGPARRMDGKDAPRFLTRYISEMWGVFIFADLEREWDYMNVVVRGLRGHVSHAGLKPDTSVTTLPNHSDVGGRQASSVNKAFFNARLNAEEWIYRVRFERLGDGFDPYRDFIRRQQQYWYIESPEGGHKMGHGVDVDG